MATALGWSAIATILLCLAAPPACAQYADPPQSYSMTEMNTLFGGAGTMREIHRNGSKVLVDLNVPPSRPGSSGSHSRSLYDLETHRSYTWDLIHSETPCNAAIFSGDWGDPFVFAGQTAAEFGKANPKPLGTESVNGFTAKVTEAETPQIKVKLWTEPKYGLIVRLQMLTPSGSYVTRYEIKGLSLSPPPPSLFVLPAVCTTERGGRR